jgi:hypothetical protein
MANVHYRRKAHCLNNTILVKYTDTVDSAGFVKHSSQLHVNQTAIAPV